jgi:ABC-type dipeptide/oligopeptide/nickel transport system permease subunit
VTAVVVAEEVADLTPTGNRVWRRVVKDRSALCGFAVAALFVLGAVFAPLLSADPTATDFTNRFAGPSTDHLLGTDQLGRDEFSRILHGGRPSLGMALAATVGVTSLGIVLGLLAAMWGNKVEAVIMRLVDVLQSLPTLILALVIVGLLGQGLRNLVITIILIQWPQYARVVRGMTLSLRERDFVEAARAVGASRLRIVARHVTPNLLGPVIVLSTIDMGRTLLAVSGLSFLGFGVAPPSPEWGSMLAESRAFIERAPQLLGWPGLAITLVVLAFNLAGDGLRDALDPRGSEPTPGWERRRLLPARPAAAPAAAD